MDFVSDSLADGRSFRALAIVDHYTRECPVIEVDLSLPGARVVRLLEQLAKERGLPAAICVDNGLNATSFFGSRQKISSGRRKRQPMRHKLPNNQGNPVVFHDWET